MPTILACVNLKGGVGKTAIAVNFAAYCGRKGMRTLLVDCDPQTNATFSCMSGEDWVEHAKQLRHHRLAARGAEHRRRDEPERRARR